MPPWTDLSAYSQISLSTHIEISILPMFFFLKTSTPLTPWQSGRRLLRRVWRRTSPPLSKLARRPPPSLLAALSKPNPNHHPPQYAHQVAVQTAKSIGKMGHSHHKSNHRALNFSQITSPNQESQTLTSESLPTDSR